MNSTPNYQVLRYTVPAKDTDLITLALLLQGLQEKGILSGYALSVGDQRNRYMTLGSRIVNSVLRFFHRPGKYAVLTVVIPYPLRYTELGKWPEDFDRLMALNTQ